MQQREFSAHVAAQLGVKVRQRFIEQKHLRLTHDGAADGDTLALAARQFFGFALQQCSMFSTLAAAATLASMSACGRPAMRSANDMFCATSMCG